MMTGRSTGRFLTLLSKLLQPKAILEVGTFTGYGTLCLAEGLVPGGHIDTMEVNPEVAVKARRHFEEAGLGDTITLHEGDARDIIPTLTGTYNLIFLDADKKAYPHYLELLLPRLAPGGMLIADNVLWYGKVTAPEGDKDALVLDAFNKAAASHADTDNLLLTIDDGLMLMYKRP